MGDWVVMGHVVAPYGLGGWIKVKPHTSRVDGLLDYSDWYLGSPAQWQNWRVESSEVHGLFVIAKLAGIAERNAALVLKNMAVAVPRDAMPACRDNEYYWVDLLGLAVINQQDVELGKVSDVFATGANDVLVVRGNEKERVLPFIASVVLDVDLVSKTMRVDWSDAW